MDRYTFINYQSKTKTYKKYQSLLLVKDGGFYIGISKTTPWVNITDIYINDDNPPIPDKEINRLDELVILKKVEEIKLAKESSCGNRFIMDKMWSVYDIKDIQWSNGEIIPDITHILFKVLLKPDDFLSSTIRTISLHSHPVFINERINEYEVIPSSLIKDQGLIHWVSNSTPLQRDDLTNVYSEINILLEI